MVPIPDPANSDLSTTKLLHLTSDFSFDTIELLLTAAVRTAWPVGEPDKLEMVTVLRFALTTTLPEEPRSSTTPLSVKV